MLRYTNPDVSDETTRKQPSQVAETDAVDEKRSRCLEVVIYKFTVLHVTNTVGQIRRDYAAQYVRPSQLGGLYRDIFTNLARGDCHRLTQWNAATPFASATGKIIFSQK